MKRTIAFLLALCLFLYTFAQDSVKNRKANVQTELFKGSHLSISLIPHLTKKADIRKRSGLYDLKASNVGGIELGVNYHINFNQTYSLLVGVHGGASGRNYKLYIPRQDFTPPLMYDYDGNGSGNGTFDFYLSAPLLFERRWMNKRYDHWNLYAGIDMRFYPDEIFESQYTYVMNENNQPVEVVRLDLEVGNAFTPWLTYTIGGGYSWLLGNYNFLRLNFVANLSTTDLVKGTYEINVPGKPATQGSYAANLSYAGVSINYLFTGTNKRLRKLYEKKLNYQ